MDIRSPVTPHVAGVTLHYFGERGSHVYAPSDWRLCLIELIVKSDSENRAKLRIVYPAQVEAIDLFQYGRTGAEILRDIATADRDDS